MTGEIHQGIVIFTRANEQGTWGFIEPDDSDGRRESNVWFADKRLFGSRMPQKGEPVEFLFFNSVPKDGHVNRGAYRVWPKGERPYDI